MLYRLSNLTKAFDNRTVVEIPSLRIENGGRFALLVKAHHCMVDGLTISKGMCGITPQHHYFRRHWFW